MVYCYGRFFDHLFGILKGWKTHRFLCCKIMERQEKRRRLANVDLKLNKIELPLVNGSSTIFSGDEISFSNFIGRTSGPLLTQCLNILPVT